MVGAVLDAMKVARLSKKGFLRPMDQYLIISANFVTQQSRVSWL